MVDHTVLMIFPLFLLSGLVQYIHADKREDLAFGVPVFFPHIQSFSRFLFV